MLQEKVTQLNGQNLANVVWALATVQEMHEPLMTIVARTRADTIQGLGPQEYSNIVWSFATMKGLAKWTDAEILFRPSHAPAGAVHLIGGGGISGRLDLGSPSTAQCSPTSTPIGSENDPNSACTRDRSGLDPILTVDDLRQAVIPSSHSRASVSVFWPNGVVGRMVVAPGPWALSWHIASQGCDSRMRPPRLWRAEARENVRAEALADIGLVSSQDPPRTGIGPASTPDTLEAPPEFRWFKRIP